jgi:hypothetical protein
MRVARLEVTQDHGRRQRGGRGEKLVGNATNKTEGEHLSLLMVEKSSLAVPVKHLLPFTSSLTRRTPVLMRRRGLGGVDREEDAPVQGDVKQVSKSLDRMHKFVRA